jgi:hypothetical protein
MNAIGLVAAATAFLSIWLGHVSVRRIESAASGLVLPTAAFIGGGVLLEALSARSTNLHVSAAAGILGITLLWDAVELWRQQARVREGHALKREPRRVQVALDDATQDVPHQGGAASSTRA